ncbi:MAG: carbohydrate kinase family protein [Nitrososphaerales archaeon]
MPTEMMPKTDSKYLERISRVSSLQGKLHELGSVAVMPDYFVDRFVKMRSFELLSIEIREKGVAGGGGSIRGVSQTEVKGGNAVNVGYSLGKLGVGVNLYAIADGLAAIALRSTFSPFLNVELEVIKGKCGFTTAFEFLEQDRLVNVMVSDVGDLQNFDGSKIEDWSKVKGAKIVSVLNWASNQKGTDLCERAFSKKSKSAMTFFDPADLTEVSNLLPDFKKRILDPGLLDVISINDNETRAICRALTDYALPQDYTIDEISVAVRKIQDTFGSTVDLHTRKLSLTCNARDVLDRMPCHKVDQKTVTGAGDVWDSADLLGYLADWDAMDRLAFANAAAGLYVSTDTATSPTFAEVLDFMKS